MVEREQMSYALPYLFQQLSTTPFDINYCRKVSDVKTKECPIYDVYGGCWRESDAQFAERICNKPSKEARK